MVADEKVLLRKIRYSLKSGKSRAEITKRLQSDGLKLEYINKLISKAKRPRRLLVAFTIIFTILILSGIVVYYLIFNSNKTVSINPLEGYNLVKNKSGAEGEITLEEIELTPEYSTYILDEIGADELHKNPLTFEEPIINVNIGNESFYSLIDGRIESFEGKNSEADIEITIPKEDLVTAILSENSTEEIEESFTEGNAEIELLTTEKELFAKGYLSLYNSLTG